MTERLPKISVIVPVYNSEKHLEQCLDSIVNQDYSNIEIVLINDGSTDGSLEIINRFEKKYNNIIVINQRNLGVVQARINGYLASTGKYIAWVDSDDFIKPSMFKKMMGRLVKNDAEVVICDYEFYPKRPQNKVKWYKQYKGIVDPEFVNKNTVQWNKLVDRKLLERIDIAALLKDVGEGAYIFALIHAEKIETIDEELYTYRVGETSISSNYKNIEWYERGVEKSRKGSEIIMNSPYGTRWSTYFDYHVYYSLLITLIICAYNNDRMKYSKYSSLIREKKYIQNIYIKTLLKSENNLPRYFVLRFVIPYSFLLSRVIAKYQLRSKSKAGGRDVREIASPINNVEVLLSVMDSKSPPIDIAARSNIQTDAIIINQCDAIGYQNLHTDTTNIKFISLPERGVGLSRNNALMRCTGEIVLFADEDETLVDGYEEIIINAFKKMPKADMILFNIVSANINNPCYRIRKSKRVRRYNSLRYGAPRIAVKRAAVKQSNVYFSLLFGGGAEYSNGEDSIFIYQCIERGLRVYTCTENIGTVSQQNSTWFKGYNDKFFEDKGAFFYCLSPKLAYLYMLQFAIRKRGYNRNISTFHVLKLMHRGVLKFRRKI